MCMCMCVYIRVSIHHVMACLQLSNGVREVGRPPEPQESSVGHAIVWWSVSWNQPPTRIPPLLTVALRGVCVCV